MPQEIFVNLPVKDLTKSVEFFTKLGYTFNKQFTDENATCMIVSEHIYVMLLVEPFFKTFISKELVDARKATEVLMGIGVENREDVDKIVDSAVAAGGVSPKDPVDHGFMYSRTFEDLDGHIWEYVWMNPKHIESNY